jgi:hypothetical protein
VVAFFHHAALVEHDEPVHRRDGREAVGDGDHGLAFHQPVQAGLDGGFDLGVERAGGFVEQQDGRVLEHHARDGDALALAARQLHAAFADVGRIAGAALGVAQRADEIVRFGALGSGADRLVARVGPAIGDVVGHRAVQQRGVLRDHADVLAQ